MNEEERERHVPNKAPPGLFFTKAAFLKYSALARVKEASAAKRHDQPSLPRPLGPLPKPLARAAQSKARTGLAPSSKAAKPPETQDAVVPELQSPDGAASEELASEDIWGDDDTDTGMEDDSARLTADSTEQAAPVPETAAKHGTRAATRKRQAAAPAKGERAPKQQRRQPKGPQGAKRIAAAAKPAAAPSKGTDARKAGPSRKHSKGAGSIAAELPEPNAASEATSEVQAAKAEFMRTMGLQEPRAFSSSSRGTASRSAQRPQPASARNSLKHGHAGWGPQQALGRAGSRQTQAQSQPAPKQAEPASSLQRNIVTGPTPAGQQQAQPQGTLGQLHPEAAAEQSAQAALALRQEPGDAVDPAAMQPGKASQGPAASALNVSVPLSASPGLAAPQDPLPEALPGGVQLASLAHQQQAALQQRHGAGVSQLVGAVSAAGKGQDRAAAIMSIEAAPAHLGSSPVPTSPEAPKEVQLLGGSGRPAENGVKLVNLLNPNNPQYDQAFALEYARMKAAAGKDAGKGHRKQGPKRIYSNVTAQEHAWYLAKQGLRLHGRDVERMADLSEKVAEEQQQFIRAQWLDAQDSERFRYMDPRVEAQLQAHFHPMKEAVKQLPRLWQLHGQLPLAAALQGFKQAPAMAHLSTPVSSGQPSPFTPPAGHTAVPLDRPYMPQGESSAPSRWLHQDETALQLAAEKRAAVLMADEAFAELAQTAVQGFLAGWEIPVTVTPSSSDGDSQQAPQSAVVALSSPLLKRALSRREKHERLFAAAILALGHDRSLNQDAAQAGDWRKQLLQELGASAGAEQAQEAQGLGPVPQTQKDAAEGDCIAVPVASISDQPALRYSLWRLGEHRIITRAQVHAAMQGSPATQHSIAAVVQAKMEYHGNKASDAEEVTAEELVRWWSATHIRPGSHVLVGHVGVHSCQVLRSQHFTVPELLDSAAGAGFRPAMTWRLMSAVLEQLTSLPLGQYLLTHQPSSDAICLFAATSEADVESEGDVAPLPCMTDAPKGTIFDLWSAHAQSGATDESQLGFIPKMWQPSFPDVPQIPYTFTPRQNPGKRRGQKVNPKGTATGAGHILDWDTKPQKAGASDTTFSAAKYAELLQEDF